jgi:hypothetical protein
MTKNVTLAFDDDTLAKLRVYAAERKTTVNAIFRKHAENLVGNDARRREAREWMVAKGRENLARDAERRAAGATGGALEPSIWNREEIYAERLNRWPKGDR